MEARTLEIPQSVREVIRQRLKPLSNDCRSASLGGRRHRTRFSTSACLEQSTRLEPARVLDHLGGSRARRNRRAGRRRSSPLRFFSHALIRETVYADLPLASRASFHQRVGIVSGGAPRPAAERASRRARPSLPRRRRRRQRSRKGDRILHTGRATTRSSAIAYGEAAIHYRNALAGARGPASRTMRSGVAVCCSVWATAQHRSGRRRGGLAGDVSRSREDRPRNGTRAAISRWQRSASAAGVPTPGVADESLIRILEEALASLGDEEPRLRVRLHRGASRSSSTGGARGIGWTSSAEVPSSSREVSAIP